MILSLFSFKKSRLSLSKVFIAIIFLGFFLVLIINEANSPYRYSTVLVLSLMSAGRIFYLINKKQIIHLGCKAMKRMNDKTKTEGE